VHSFLAQAEYVGEIMCGLAIAVVARFAGLPPALVACGALFTVTVLLIQRHGTSGTSAVRQLGRRRELRDDDAMAEVELGQRP
jgi:MFS transporter, DHA3 family, tetracycline resistance protein